jgi:LysR family transcriptional regulator for bpeEF and oprC
MELIQSMRLFTKLAELKSFTKASEALQIGRPQVTLAISQLEASLGVRLFQRTTRRVSLTAEGEAFLAKAEEVLGGVDEALNMFGTPGETVRGRLRIDIPSALAIDSFIEAIGRFRGAFPGIALTLGVSDRSVDMVAEGVDCVLRIGELPSSSLVARRLGAATMVTCAAPGYLDAAAPLITPDDLSSHVCASFQSGTSKRSLPWHFNVAGMDSSVLPKSTILVNDSTAYVLCAKAGFGLIQVPGLLVDRYLKDGTLIEVLAGYRPAARPISLVYPTRSYTPPQVRAFYEWLRQHFMAIEPVWLE